MRTLNSTPAPRRSLAARALPLLLALAASSAHGQWTVTNLSPNLTYESTARATSAQHQVGSGGFSSNLGAVVWSMTAGSMSVLNTPSGTGESGATGVSGTRIVGYGQIAGVGSRALLWPTLQAAPIQLNLAGATTSRAYGVRGDQTVGVAGIGNTAKAVLWNGTDPNGIDLTPGTLWAEAYGTDGVTQVGIYLGPGNNRRACRWNGSALSFYSLHPDGASESYALGVDNAQTVGFVVVGDQRPALWNGSSTAWVDLTPQGGFGGKVNGIHVGVQVGQVFFSSGGGQSVAAVWYGSSGSFVNLGAYLPQNYTYSNALGIWVEGGRTFVAGVAFNGTTGKIDPILWRSPAISSSVSGIIGLNDVVWNPAYPRTITATVKQGATTLATRTISVGTVGALSMNVPGAGNAVVTIDGPTQLIRRRNVYLDGNPIDLGSVVLNNGDCDGSGEVDAGDIDLVISEFGQLNGLGDVDLSGEVDAADIDITIANFGNVDE